MHGIESWPHGHSATWRRSVVPAVFVALVGAIFVGKSVAGGDLCGTLATVPWPGTLQFRKAPLPAERSLLAPTGSKQGSSSRLVAQSNSQALSGARVQSRSLAMTELKSRHLFTITIKLHPIQELGDTPAGNRRVVPVSGGNFSGPRLRGKILPYAGSDLLLGRADGSFQQDVRMVLRTDDGALILMTYRGVRHASQETNARIARGEPVSPSDYYLRTTPFFETSSPEFAWLNKIVAVGIGERRPDGVIYEVFEIL
jgi:hypothetical protein